MADTEKIKNFKANNYSEIFQFINENSMNYLDIENFIREKNLLLQREEQESGITLEKDILLTLKQFIIDYQIDGEKKTENELKILSTKLLESKPGLNEVCKFCTENLKGFNELEQVDFIFDNLKEQLGLTQKNTDAVLREIKKVEKAEKKFFENELKTVNERLKKLNVCVREKKITDLNTCNDEKTEWENYVVPEKYGCSEKGVKVFYIDKLTGEEKEEIVSGTPFVLCGRSQAKGEREQYFTIRHASGQKGEAQKEFCATMTDLLEVNTMQKTLTGHGINVSSENKIAANKYISNFISELQYKLKITEVYEQNGWNEDCSKFVIGKNAVTREKTVKINSLVKNQKHIAPFERRGSIKEWVRGVNHLINFPKQRFFFYHAMAAPLIKILCVEQDIIDINGSTSTGKSTSLMCVSSAIGNPANKAEGYALEVGDSFNPLMAHAAGLRDMPVVFEEATGKNRRNALIKAVYNLTNGTDKQRADKTGGLRDDVKDIRSTVLISCEQAIAPEIKTAGGRQRVKDLTEVFPVNKEMGEKTEESRKIFLENYGWFFPLYVKKIINEQERVKKLYEEALEAIKVQDSLASGTISRSKSIFAAKLVAGWLCEELFKKIKVNSLTKTEASELVNAMFSESVLETPVKPDWIRALELLQDTVASEYGKGFKIEDEDFNEIDSQKNFSKRLGTIKKGNIEIIEKELTDLLNKNDFSSATMKNEWSKQMIAKKTCIRIEGMSIKGWSFNRSRIEEITGYKNEVVENGLFYKDFKERTNLVNLISTFTSIKGFCSKEDIKNVFQKETQETIEILIKQNKIREVEKDKFTSYIKEKPSEIYEDRKSEEIYEKMLNESIQEFLEKQEFVGMTSRNTLLLKFLETNEGEKLSKRLKIFVIRHRFDEKIEGFIKTQSEAESTTASA